MSTTRTSAAYSFTFRICLPNRPGSFARVTAAIAGAGGDLGDVSILAETREEMMREITVLANSLDHQKTIHAALQELQDVSIHDVEDCTFTMHEGGKMEIHAFHPLESQADLSMAYTPGVARVCMAVHDDVKQAYNLTIKGNTVAVVSDGTAVLGLGDIGPEAAMPVMEGKCLLFKTFADVDAYPICLATKDVEEIIQTIKVLGPTFGGINLEDISAPRCFEIEDRLKEMLDIPVFHDDQHGTAVVSAAALINALKLTGKTLTGMKAVVCGVGAAGVACSQMLMSMGLSNIIGVDSLGAIYKGRTERMNSMKDWYAENTNPERLQGSLSDVIAGADLFLGVSGPGALRVEDLKRMAPDPIIFAMANPVPEIMPEVAAPYVSVMATGRSDYPNQINNVLAFPGIFRGALDVRARKITEGMKIAAAEAIASVVNEDELRPDFIIPSPLDPRVAPAVAEAVRKAAVAEGVADPHPASMPEFSELSR